MTEFIVYSRRGCHLCEQLIEELEPLLRGRAHLEVRDVDSRGDWEERYGTRVPVLVADGQFVCEYFLDRDRVVGLVNAGATKRH